MINRHSSRGRHHEKQSRATLPLSSAAFDYFVMLSLLLLPAGVIWVLGGNRDWIMMPAVLLLYLATAAFTFRFLVSRYRLEVAVPPAGGVTLLFLGYLGMTILFSSIPYEAVLQFFKFTSYVFAYWVWFNLLRINSRWRWALAAVLLSVIAMASFAIIQDVQGTRSAVFAERHSDYGMRASGAYICPNHFAHLLVMAILAGLGLLSSRRAGLALKLIAGYAVLISLYPLLLSESRSAWIGLMVGVVVLSVVMALGKGFKKAILVLLLAPLLVGASGWVIWKLSPRVQYRVEDALRGNIRIPLWRDSIEVAKLNPWIGNGLGSYRHIYPHYRNHLPMTNDPEFAHNEFVHFGSEIGLLGIALAAWIVMRMSSAALRGVLSSAGHPGIQALLAALVAVIAASWAHAFFDFNFNIFGNVHVYVFLMAALFAAAESREQAAIINVSGPVARRAGVAIITLLACAGGVYAQLTRSYFDYAKGKALLNAHDWEAATAEFADAIQKSKSNWRAQLAYADVMRTRAFWMRNPEIRSAWIDDAMQHYKTAGSQNPWEGNVWYGMGTLYALQGKQEDALAMRQKAAREIPRHIYHLNALGLQLLEMGRWEEARNAFLKSQEAEPNVIAERNIQLIDRRLQKPDGTL